MPMLIPIVVAFVGVGTGVVSGLAAYATIAGAVLSGVGALTGNKDLMRIGAVISIGGGIAGAVEGLAGEAAVDGAGGMANAEGATPADLTGGVGGNATLEGGATPDAALTGAGNGGDLSAPGSAPPGTAPEGAPGSLAAPGTTATPGALTQPSGAGTLGQTNLNQNSMSGAYQSTDASTAPTSASTTSTTTSADALDPNATRGTPDGTGDYGSSTGPGSAGTSSMTTPSAGPLDKIVNGARQFGGNDLQAWFQRAQGAAGSVGDFIKNNPALVKVGGDMLGAMYGPQAERLDMEKSMYERARRNLNSPIALTYTKPKG